MKKHSVMNIYSCFDSAQHDDSIKVCDDYKKYPKIFYDNGNNVTAKCLLNKLYDRKLSMMSSWVYIILCSDGSYYTGCTTNLEKRINEHQNGTFEGYTSARLPVKLVYCREFSNIQYAILAERQIKGWSKKEKAALIKGEFELLHNLTECKNETHYKNRKTR